MTDWSYVLHCDPDHSFDPDNLNEWFFERAEISAKSIDLDTSTGLDILEIGCGIGHFSKHLSDRHDVSSVDDFNFRKDDTNYQSYLKHLNWPRKHFYFQIPHHKHIDSNIENFEILKKFNKSFDYVIWQNSCLLDQPKLTQNCLESLFDNLLKIIRHRGKLIIGFDCRDEKTPTKMPFYNFLSQWQLHPQSKYGIIGSLCICLTKS